MSMTIYMAITGKNQGDIKAKSEALSSSHEHPDRKDRTLIYEFNHTTASEINSSTGIPEGTFSRLLSVTKAKDVTSPKLFQLCCDRELCTMELFFFRTINAKDSVYYSYKLEDAYLYKIDSFTPMTFLEQNKPYKDMERLYFSYAKLTQRYLDGNIEYTETPQGK